MFRDREDAGRQLAQALRGRPLRQPLVLGIPRGGVALGSVLARELGADLDIVLARKLRAPHEPELAVGAIGEDGQVFLDRKASRVLNLSMEYLKTEVEHQRAEIVRRRELFRAVRPPAPLAGRTVIVTDDGIATGATMIAALQVIRGQNPERLIVAVPVGSPDRLKEVARWCDELVCLLAPDDFHAIGQFYRDFHQLEDKDVVEILRDHP